MSDIETIIAAAQQRTQQRRQAETERQAAEEQAQREKALLDFSGKVRQILDDTTCAALDVHYQVYEKGRDGYRVQALLTFHAMTWKLLYEASIYNKTSWALWAPERDKDNRQWRPEHDSWRIPADEHAQDTILATIADWTAAAEQNKARWEREQAEREQAEQAYQQRLAQQREAARYRRDGTPPARARALQGRICSADRRSRGEPLALVIDSATILWQRLQPAKEITKAEWGKIKRQWHTFMNNLAQLTIPVIMTAHEHYDSTQGTHALTLFDHAGRIVRHGNLEEDESDVNLNTGRYHVDRAGTLIALGRSGDALDELDLADHGISPDRTRQHAYINVMRAQAYTDLNEPLIAVAIAEDTLTVSKALKSAITIARIEEIYVLLKEGKYGDSPQVARLGSMLSSV